MNRRFKELPENEEFCLGHCLEIWKNFQLPKFRIKQEGELSKEKKKEIAAIDLISLSKIQLVVEKSDDPEIPAGNYYYIVDGTRIMKEQTCSSLAANSTKTKFIEQYMEEIEPSLKTIGCLSIGRSAAHKGQRKMIPLDHGLIVYSRLIFLF